MYARRRALPTRPARPLWQALVPALFALLALWGGWSVLGRPRDLSPQGAALARTPAQDWADLAAFGPRPVGSEGHGRAAAWLAGQLRALGYRVTEQPVQVTRPFDQGGELRVGELRVPVRALYGARGGDQQGRLVRVPPDAPPERLRALGLEAGLALTTCPRGSWRDLTERVIDAGGLGLVLAQTCPGHPLERVSETPLPLVTVGARDAERVLAQAGRPASLTSRVELRTVTGHNLIAARVEARPEVLFGAHLDTVNGSPGANDNASGVLAVLEAARRAAGTPLAGRAWFVLFDAEEDGLHGSYAFITTYGFPLRDTRAMLNFDMVGVGAAPLGVEAHPELLALARRLRPDIRVFDDRPTRTRETFGRSSPLSGRSDHLNFKRQGIRTVSLNRGEDANYHAPGDRSLDPALVSETADFASRLAQAALQAPWTPEEPCGITGRDCRY